MQLVHTASRRSAKMWILPLAALLLAAAVVVPPLVSLKGLHRRIADSISRAIGRPVRMSAVKMKLLPRPGFEIADFVVEEDPGFGAEPILRSSQVTAYVRLLPLWRGRLEIARIAFDEPSLNLVRNRQGQWNFESLLSQAAQVPKAPTAERHPGALARFPYIDASNARVNFKSGDEKLPFSFLNADLVVWLENPGEWRIQFEAQPVRTDLSLDLANTGIVRWEGSLRRAATLRQMPMQLHAEWSHAPLGQLSRMLTGSDADWRGDLDVTADITGNVEHAELKLTASGQSIHRAEFEPREPLNLEVTCQARFTRAGRFLDAVTCLAPTGDGHLLLTGSLHAVPVEIHPEISLEINHLPVPMAVDGIRLVRSGFAPAVQATGTVDGSFIYALTSPSSRPQVHGQATVNGLTLVAPEFSKPLTLPALHFTTAETASPHLRRRPALLPVPQPFPPITETALLLDPFIIGQATGLPAPLTVNGAFNRTGFNIHLHGQSPIGQIAALGREFGLLRNRNVTLAPLGTADLDITIHGPWLLPVTDHPTAPATLDGSIRLRNAQLAADFLAQPLEIGSAEAVLGNNQVDWTAQSIDYGPVHGDGALNYPAFCEPLPPNCSPHFTLHIADLDAAVAQSALLGAARHGELVQRLLDRIDGDSHAWPALSGTAQIGALTIGKLAVQDVAASIAVEGNSMHIGSLNGHALDGSLRLSGSMQMSDGTPRYEIEVQLDHAATSSASALFQEKWGPGSFTLATKLQLYGFTAKELTSSVTGTFHVDWTRGGLPLASMGAIATLVPISGARSGLSHFSSWTADGSVAQGTLTVEKSRIVSGADAIPLAGTISFSRQLNLASPGPSNPLKITGTLQHPQVAVP